MASLRALALLVWVFAQVLLASSDPGDNKDCSSIFASDEAKIFGVDDKVTVQIDLSEEIKVDTLLYTLRWDRDCVDPPEINDATFTDYFSVDDSTKCMWLVSVKKSLDGVPDYPDAKDTIKSDSIFAGITNITQSQCRVTLAHEILDINTKPPEPNFSEYSVDITEDWLPGYTISDFETPVQDKDGSSPNNQFTVSVDDNCPLEATDTLYTSGMNAVSVTYKLRKKLDYEDKEQILCSVNFLDTGIPSLSGKAAITINVRDVPDEPPHFTSDFYYADIMSITESDEPLDIKPSNISATDGDTSLLSPITYSMINVQAEVNGLEYFAIDENTGEVTVKKELDGNFLLNEHVMFFLTASDSSQTANALLDVTLPPVPTTTTPATTCEPCPTYTTETVATCPPCPTYTTETVTECPTQGTCPSCPTYTTEIVTECPTQGTCPSCPTYATEAVTTCEPCPTDATEAATTCPPCPSATTETVTECPPCPSSTTETVTECPTQGTDTSTHTPTTITWDPELPTLVFEQASYVGDIYAEVNTVYQVKVKDIGYEVIYDWSDDSQGAQYFHIDPNSGWITVNKDNKPPVGIHQLQAVVRVKVAPSEQATAMVNINVVPVSTDWVSILNSVTSHTSMEGDDKEDVATLKLSRDAGNVCITRVEPLSVQGSFSLDNKDETTWKVRKTGPLNYEETHEVTLTIEAYFNYTDCPIIEEGIPTNLLRSQAIAIISVGDKNDEKPVFSTEGLVVAYPTNEGLRRAVGPVVSVQAEDKDSTALKYSLAGSDAAQFTVDEDTGEVYVGKGLDCDPDCKFRVKASDEKNEAEINVKVLPLDMEHVFTLPMSDTTVSEVDAQLTQLSDQVDAQISKLYVTPMQTPTARRGRKNKREAEVSLEVHVYSIKNGSLLSLDDLNNALGEGSSSLEAEEFIDAVVFEPETSGGGEDTLGLTVAVAVLGSLLGVVLIAGVGFFIYKRKRGAPKQPRPPTPIKTLGNAYQNQSYENEGHATQGSLGHKTNGSLNGFTSVQVHNTEDGDSPPMHRSPLALPSDSIPLKSMDSQQAGLRRIQPSAPEYYGSSTPAPPPSFTRTTVSSIDSEPSPSSSSYPIYAEIKKPKDPKPKSTSTASTPSSYRPEKSVPRPDSVDKQPAVPNADYEEVGSSTFSSLKASPPPQRSSRHKANDDDDDDVKEGVAYPGGKSDKFTDESASSDEKKSVAFKVMVDTKEIEAQNKGPAQRKAEAEKLMEANRKKLQEKGNDEDEDEDEEESANL